MHIHTHTHTTEDILTNPSTLEHYQNDPAFRKLEDKLSQAMPMQQFYNEPASKDTHTSPETHSEPNRPEETLRGVVALAAQLRDAIGDADCKDRDTRLKTASELLEKASKLLVDVRCMFV
jgi:hypothetical protein